MTAALSFRQPWLSASPPYDDRSGRRGTLLHQLADHTLTALGRHNAHGNAPVKSRGDFFLVMSYSRSDLHF
jgi:hypothetical protein